MSHSSVFQSYSQYYDLLYSDKNYEREVEYVDALLHRYGVRGRDILEIGCGTGRHARRLSGLGYHVIGIERSSQMVAAAEQTDAFQCVVGDGCETDLGRTFNAVLALFHVVSYQLSNGSLLAMFKRSAQHLESGGLFIFDVWYSPAVLSTKPEPRIKKVSDDSNRITRIAEPINFPNESRVDVHYTILVENLREGRLDAFSEVHPMRHFSTLELELAGEFCGFEKLNVEEFLTGAAPGSATWGVCFVFRKR
jgi:SAM-dependent methyltransferase